MFFFLPIFICVTINHNKHNVLKVIHTKSYFCGLYWTHLFTFLEQVMQVNSWTNNFSKSSHQFTHLESN